MTARPSDYQRFQLDDSGRIIPDSIGQRMREKMAAIPLPDLMGKTVLDVGCDFGFWTIYAANLGAKKVLGLDRGRPVHGVHTDLIKMNREYVRDYPSLYNVFFEHMNIGKQWIEWTPTTGGFDLIMLFSLYHHIFENCGDHRIIWFWLWRQTASGGMVLWENPVDISDGVAHGNISKDKHCLYTKDKILSAAAEYFSIEYIGPARHELTRSVYRFTRKPDRDLKACRHIGIIENGAGGAAKAFLHEDSNRVKEINRLFGFAPFPGSLNVKLDTPFDFGRDYYRAEILDVENRARGFNSAWSLRPCRFYPVNVNGISAMAMRFEGEDYSDKFVELISNIKLRDFIQGVTVEIERD